MGFFSRFKSASAFAAFQKELCSPAYKEAIATSLTAERFEHFVFVWKRLLYGSEKPFLAESADHIVKYYAILNLQEGANMLEAHLAAFLIPRFSELQKFKNFERNLQSLMCLENQDNGLSFDAKFAELNPISAKLLKEKYGYTPFSREQRDRTMQIISGRIDEKGAS